MHPNCLFCKIINGDIPASKLYEDDEVTAFWDIAPQAPRHFLVIPKKHITGPAALGSEDEQLIGKVMRTGARLAAENGIGDGFRMVFNNGAEAGQTVFHLHMHVLGGRAMNWPPG
ncbi:MAG: histidine triad nucleotide-binding protein [Desulfurivibrio sp.]|nr:MAG: histidine triad nucleotide-binding protein [Desulfurivibrio sp.]